MESEEERYLRSPLFSTVNEVSETRNENPTQQQHLQIPEPSFKVRFQPPSPIEEEEEEEFPRTVRRRSISMPTGLNLLLQFAEYSCQPKPGAEKDYFDEVEEQQISRSNSNSASDPRQRPQQTSAAKVHTTRFNYDNLKSESDIDDDEDDLIEDDDDDDNMSTTADELSELDSLSHTITSDPPPPYPGNRNGNGTPRRPRFQTTNYKSQIEEDDFADEFTKTPLATRRKSGGVLPIKIKNSTFEADPKLVNADGITLESGGGPFNTLKQKFNSISNTIPVKFKMRKSTPDEFKIRIFVSLLFLAIVVLIGTIYIIHHEKELKKAYFHQIRFSSKDRKFRLTNLRDKEVMSGILGMSFTSRDKAWPCLKIHRRENESCLEWMDKSRLYFRVVPSPIKDSISSLNPLLDQFSGGSAFADSQQCYGVYWESLSPEFIPKDCFYIKENRGFYFYGGGEQEKNHWPLNRTIVPLTPFVTGNKIDVTTSVGGDLKNFQWGKFLKRQFFGSAGVSIEIWKDIPLHVSINSAEDPDMICFSSKPDSFAYPRTENQNLVLNYTICSGNNIQDIVSVTQYVSTRDSLEGLRHEELIFAKNMVKTLIWKILPTIFTSKENETTLPLQSNRTVTLARNEKQLLDHADRIKALRAEILPKDNMILLDESFEKNLGDFEIDPERFPTMVQTLNYTQRRGFQIAMTIHPYFSTMSKNYIDGLEKKLWVKEKPGHAKIKLAHGNSSYKKVPALVQYQNSVSSVLLDVTKDKSRSWFEDKVRSLAKKYSLNGLFIELGSTADLPQYYEFSKNLSSPDEYQALFIQSIRNNAGINTLSVSSAIQVPKLPAFVSLSPIESSWEGLQSIIPNLLTLGMNGFSCIMTGPIGGSYKRQVDSTTVSNSPLSAYEANKPERNLYIRWLELTYFLPIIQYSYLPSDYDAGVEEIVRSMKKEREEKKIEEKIEKAIDDSLITGKPIIQPLWMIDPYDPNCLRVSDQYIIGGQILVAPILKFNSTERDIYLPKGKWKDGIDGSTTKGGKWLHQYTVKENNIAFFTKLSDFYL